MISMGIENFIKEIKALEGKRVSIKTNHLLYGNQKIKYDLCVIDDKGRLGFLFNNENEIYIDKEDICDFGIIKGMYFWADKLMRIEIQTT